MGCRQSKEKMCNDKDMLKHVNEYFLGDTDTSKKKLSMAEQIIQSRTIKIRKSRQQLLEESISNKDKSIVFKYHIQALIGKGKFTKVYRVQNKLSKEPFALKLNCQNGSNCCTAFLNEVHVLQRISHKNILRISEIFMKGDNNVIGSVVTLCTGGTLLDKLLTSALLEKETSMIIGQVLDALDYLHGVGITHRDLKPSNILFYLPAKNYIIITDFTLAYTKSSQDDIFMRDICGTPDFLAPEVVRREAYTNTVDLWAVGVITYMMLTCLYPFDNSERVTLFKQIANAEYKASDEAILSKSAESRHFISSLLVVSNRPSASECLQHPWIGQKRHGYTSNELKRLNERCRSSQSSSFSSSSGSSLESIMRLSASFHLREDQHNRRVSNNNLYKNRPRRRTVNVY